MCPGEGGNGTRFGGLGMNFPVKHVPKGLMNVILSPWEWFFKPANRDIEQKVLFLLPIFLSGFLKLFC